jgi:uracil-DNA glycosylase
MSVKLTTLSAQTQGLIKARQGCRLCMDSHPGLIRNGSEFDFDPPVMSHWSQWLGDLQPKILIVGQDFGDIRYFQRFRGLDDPHSQTNSNLYGLLMEAGFHPKPPPVEDTSSGIFLTNSLLCFKTSEGMSGAIKSRWSRSCTLTHLLPLINLLKPKVIVALGGPAWVSLRDLFGLKSTPKNIMSAAGGHWTVGAAEIFAVGHCGGLGMRNRRKSTQIEDWQRIGSFVARDSV